jgi:hypothetical protein
VKVGGRLFFLRRDISSIIIIYTKQAKCCINSGFRKV